jgi:hypothetical protein
MPITALLRSFGGAAPSAPAAGHALADIPLALIAATLAAAILVASAKKLYTWARVNYYLAKVRNGRARERVRRE